MFLCTSHAFFAQEAENESDAIRFGIERWDVKVLIDSLASGVNFTPAHTTIDSLINIQRFIAGFTALHMVMEVSGL